MARMIVLLSCGDGIFLATSKFLKRYPMGANVLGGYESLISALSLVKFPSC